MITDLARFIDEEKHYIGVVNCEYLQAELFGHLPLKDKNNVTNVKKILIF